MDSENERTFGNSVTMIGLEGGEHTLNFYAIDNVKNTETKKTFQFYLDRIPPVVNNAIEGDQYLGRYTYVSATTKMNLSATDNKAGVKGSITVLMARQ